MNITLQYLADPTYSFVIHVTSSSEYLSGCQFRPLVGEGVHLLPGHAVRGHHVSEHVSHHGELLAADRAPRLPRVPLHMLDQVTAVGVSCSTYMAGDRAVCGRQRGGETIQPQSFRGT